jgi:hypothetical protein
MASGHGQRRAAKALRRKVLVKAKRQAELAGGSPVTNWGWESDAPVRATYKASEALITLADPLTHDDDDRNTRYNCLAFAMIAWNLSLLPADRRKEEMYRLFDTISGIAEDIQHRDQPEGTRGSALEEVMDDLILRKMVLYPSDRRWLVHLDVSETSRGYHVSVASALPAAA